MSVKKIAKRNIIVIDEEKCNGCGQCIPNCPEGAIQIVDGKARLISDLLCDGLGACLGHCPQGAISIIEREAEPYDERKVMSNMVRQGKNVIKAHLEHLRDHGQMEYLSEALLYLDEKGIENPVKAEQKNGPGHGHHTGCPGSRMFDFRKQEKEEKQAVPAGAKAASELRQWPVQMHLVSPVAPYFRNADVVLAADCTAYALGSFHSDYLKGKALGIACPKLDQDQDIYIQKIKSWIEDAKINTLTVLIMQVPCCHGLLGLAQQALSESNRKVPLKAVVVGLQGEILSEEWV